MLSVVIFLITALGLLAQSVPVNAIGGNVDLSGATTFRGPNAAGATTSQNGQFIYDTTNKNIHWGANGDLLAGLFGAVPTDGNCLKASVAASVVRIVDYGAACAAASNYSQTFTNQTSVTLTHSLNTVAIVVQCFDGSTPPLQIGWNSLALTDANNATVTFTNSQSGKCIIAGGAGGGGGGGGGAVNSVTGSAPIGSSGGANPNITITTFTGDSGAGGAEGSVPAPAAGDAALGKVLGSGGTWIEVQPTVTTTVTFSTTPVFNGKNVIQFKLTLTGNVTSSSLTNQKNGQFYTWIICQDGSGGHTFVWPTNVKGTMTIGSTASTCSAQSFMSDGTNAYAVSVGVINQ